MVNAPDGSHLHIFLEMIHDLNLVKNVLDSTRFRENCEPSRLDYIFTDEENMIYNLEYEVPIGKSDHVCLSWQIIIESDQLLSSSRVKLNYWKGDYAKTKEQLSLWNGGES